MIRTIILALFVFSSIASRAGQAPTDSIPVNPADVSSVNAIIAALYDVISGDAGVKRNWDRMRTLFVPEARMTATGQRPDGTRVKRSMSVEDYINNSGPYLEKNGFFEVEIGRAQHEYGNIVQVFSSYASRQKQSDANPFMRGINSIQLWNDGNRWWIISILWESETKNNPIPQQFLNK